MEQDNSALKLCFIRRVGIESDKLTVFEFFFSEDLDKPWGEDFGEVPASICSDLVPYADSYSLVKKAKIDFPLSTICESTQFSVQDAYDKCVCLAYEDVSEREYPEFRAIFHFGDTYDDVELKLSQKGASLI